MTGVILSPLGALATIGDGTKTVESGVDLGRQKLNERVVCSIILGD